MEGKRVRTHLSLFFFQWLVVAYLVAVFMGGLAHFQLGLNRIALGGIDADKVAHILAYGSMVVLLRWSFRKGNKVRKSVLIAGIHGLLLELVQLVVPWRSFELLDLVADGIGISCAWALLKLWERVF